MQGLIVKALSGFYYVACNGTVYECRARGSFRKNKLTPLVGDKVVFTADGTAGTVEEILPRKSVLMRPAVANIDRLMIVSAYKTPTPDAGMIDRMTALAVLHGIEPVIVFNKCDLGDFSAWEKIYRHAGFPVVTVSAKNGAGLALLADEMRGRISAFAGNSGVGKSSLINALLPQLTLPTGDVSEKLGRGRHTTRHTEWFGNPQDGFAVDTPGFATVDAEENLDLKEHLVECFPDLAPFAADCRFSTCTHTCEQGCGVLAALRRGAVEPTRHAGYCSLWRELKDLRAWQLKK